MNADSNELDELVRRFAAGPRVLRAADAGAGRPPHGTRAVTVESWLRTYAGHLDVHARQIDRNVAAFREDARVG